MPMPTVHRIAVLRILFFAMAVGPFSAATVHAAEDFKPISPAVCQPVFTGKPIDPAVLRVLADGVANHSTSAQFVICPVPKDADGGWKQDSVWNLSVKFRKMDNASPPTSGNSCSLVVGTVSAGTFKSTTKAVSGVSGVVVFSHNDGITVSAIEPATLVCLIAPRNVLEFATLVEGPLEP